MSLTFAALVLFVAVALAYSAFDALRSDPYARYPSRRAGAIPDNADLLSVLGPQVGARWSEGNRIQLLENGDAIFGAMLDAIDSATESVHLLTYIFWGGEIAERFVDTLHRASERGVTVRLIVDAYGGSAMPKPLRRRLERGPCELRWFRPLRWLEPRRSTRRTHRKILVVDGRVGFTGGVGIAQEWAGTGRAQGEWRDDHFLVRGPAVADLQGAFAETWLSVAGELLVGSSLFPSPEAAGDAEVLAINSTPEGRDSCLSVVFWMMIHRARERLDIATPYFVPHPELLDELIRRAQAGVRVRLLLPGDSNDSRLARWSSLALYPRVIEAGIELYQYTPTMMHAKVLVSDGVHAVIGSANLDNRSFELNHESVFVVRDRLLAEELHASFEHDLSWAIRIEEGQLRRIGRLRTSLSNLVLAFRALL